VSRSNVAINERTAFPASLPPAQPEPFPSLAQAGVGATPANHAKGSAHHSDCQWRCHRVAPAPSHGPHTSHPSHPIWIFYLH